MDLPMIKETVTKIDIRTRQAAYLSPEHLEIGKKLKEIIAPVNDWINPSEPQIVNLLAKSQLLITKQCDIYSIGAILYKMLLGEVPSPDCGNKIGEQKL